ncbi:MAG: hypothetical protein OXJ37_22900 [Bryobacterales bacterium]|nr:hypothetical protein [Bryobacterales bacterium]MDE0265267.1 hypothetical protein [Bryobacterales bacterium]MDE0620603.1 hypothetical protein [Bryobacterales bacterium]
MKWVMKTSRLIVGTDDGNQAYSSLKQCPPEVLSRFKDSAVGPNACTIVITNREALEAIRSRAIEAPGRVERAEPAEEQAREKFTMPRWQALAGSTLAAVALLTALLVWAMHG